MSKGYYQDLEVWKRAMEMAVDIYTVSSKLPAEEVFGLKSQMRRAGISIASNIAEGWGRNSKQEFIRFLRIANGSLRELETQLLLCERLSYLSNEDIRGICDNILITGKQLQSLINYISTKRTGEKEL